VRLALSILLCCLSANAATITSVLRASSNPNYFTDATGKGVILVGSQTWNDFLDLGLASGGSVTPLNFDQYVTNLVFWGHSATIVWHKDFPQMYNWGAAGGSTTWIMSPYQWARNGPGNATDGLLKFDFTVFDTNYFARLRSRVIELQTNGIYAIVQLFDGTGLIFFRGSGDGYPYTAANNINGIDDGGGSSQTSMTMVATNAITDVQDKYIAHVISQIGDLPNILWEPSEEAPTNSQFWQNHVISVIRAVEATNTLQHPIMYASLTTPPPTDSVLYNSAADAVAPGTKISTSTSCGTNTPTCKVVLADSDHLYFGMWNDSQQVNRNWIWEEVCNGHQGLFMDPYVIYWPTGTRNIPSGIVNGVGSAPTNYWNNLRFNLGWIATYIGKINKGGNLVGLTVTSNSICSTGWCLGNTSVNSNQFLAYAPSGGTFTMNLSTANGRVIAYEWLDPKNLTNSPTLTVAGGSAAQSFTPPWGSSQDAVLLAQDSALTNTTTVASVGTIAGLSSGTIESIRAGTISSQ
jgi:hypothetical protein